MDRFFQQLLLIVLLIIKVHSIQSEQQCQAITYYECKNIGYNQTYLPNKFNHQDQKDVALVVRQKASYLDVKHDVIVFYSFWLSLLLTFV
jgi:hypothetical protein